jgi:hypothetical protein
MKKALIALAVVAVVGGFGYAFAKSGMTGEGPYGTPAATSTYSTPAATSTYATPASASNPKKVTINGVTITPLKVTEDSRCAIGVQCIWAGTLKLSANLSKPSGNFDAVLEIGKPVSTGTEEVTLVSATPYPRQGESIAFKDYKFVFDVTVLPSDTENPGTGGCYVGGCSAQLCTEERGAVSTCEYRESYACYKTAKCERQPNGQCGWTPGAALNSCLMNSQ